MNILSYIKKIFGVLLLFVGWGLIVANAPAPLQKLPSYSIDIQKQLGEIEITVDRRLYQDKSFEVALPPGKYRSFTLTRLANPNAEEKKAVVLLDIKGPDPRLQTSNVRFSLKDVKHPNEYKIVVKDNQGQMGSLHFSIRPVHAQIEDRPLPDSVKTNPEEPKNE